MKIDPGYYKIKDRDNYLPTYHHLYVYYDAKKTKMLRVDNEIPVRADRHEDELKDRFELVKKYTLQRPLVVTKAKITVEWQDEDGDIYQDTARNASVFFNVLLNFPRVAKALRFTRETIQQLRTILSGG